MLEIRGRTITYKGPEISKKAEEAREEIISECCCAEEPNMALDLVVVLDEPPINNLELSENCEMDAEMTNDPEFTHNEERTTLNSQSSVINKNEETARNTPCHSMGKVATTSHTDSSSVTGNVRMLNHHIRVLCI